ncbi:5-methylcytosine restriction system specificity protein McrC [Psychrobacter fulvigenes]|uniref:5-methylcytosine restriction system specificity protein McrC n=1 Tax=Psychrobacter fulvigenes TaxID=533323 RepID=UPI001D10E492
MSQSDIYQMFAYGHKYLSGSGDLILIYPKHEKLVLPMPYFRLDKSLRLWVIPFCIESDRLVHGTWIEHFSPL